MKRERVEHPAGTHHAFIGYDDTVGWYAEVWDRLGRLCDEYDGLATSSPTTTAGVLRCLAGHGFFSLDDVADAVGFLPHIDDANDVPDEGVRRAVRVILTLKKIGAD